MTDPKEALVAALADARARRDGTGLQLTYAAEDIAARTPETLDKMLLGFAVAEMPDGVHLFISDKGGVVWGESIPINTGPTPLAAVEAALKELHDD